MPYCSSLDCPGFLTRTVADAVLMLDATQGRDALDPATLGADERVAALARDVEANVARRVEASRLKRIQKRGRLKRALKTIPCRWLEIEGICVRSLGSHSRVGAWGSRTSTSWRS